MLKFPFSALFSFAITLVLAMFLSCSGGDDEGDGSGGNEGGGWPFDSSGEQLQASPGLEELELENVIEIKYKNGSSPEIDNNFDEVSINPNGENVIVSIPNTSTTEYSFVISGATSNGSLKFYGDVRKKLYLNGVSIKNNSGPAINIQKSGRVIVHLINGTQNVLEDGTNYNIPDGEQAKGTFFSESKLNFEGSGSLEVKGKYNHAIVADNDFEINNGTIVVSESVNDGIHANDKIEVKGGFLKISSKGDAIQSEKEGTSKIIITGGKIAATTTGAKSHGIASEGPTSISGDAIIQISVLGNGSKGIRSREWVEFKGEQTSIKTSGTKHTDSADPEDESNSAGIKLAGDLFIEGGELTIKSLGSGAKGINTNGGKIETGNVNIEADDDGIKVQQGSLSITGGIVYIKSKKKQAIDGTYTKTGGDVQLIDSEF
jgi:hypothetical protein